MSEPHSIQFSGVSIDPKLNRCDEEGCLNGACTSVWNHPKKQGRQQFNLCGIHLKELYEQIHAGVAQSG